MQGSGGFGSAYGEGHGQGDGGSRRPQDADKARGQVPDAGIRQRV